MCFHCSKADSTTTPSPSPRPHCHVAHGPFAILLYPSPSLLVAMLTHHIGRPRQRAPRPRSRECSTCRSTAPPCRRRLRPHQLEPPMSPCFLRCLMRHTESPCNPTSSVTPRPTTPRVHVATPCASYVHLALLAHAVASL